MIQYHAENLNILPEAGGHPLRSITQNKGINELFKSRNKKNLITYSLWRRCNKTHTIGRWHSVQAWHSGRLQKH